MKKHSLLFLSVFFLFACSYSKTDMPRLGLKTIYLNDGDTDYSHNLEDILPLSKDDYIDVSFSLDGNGADLKTFVVRNDYESIIKSEIIPFLQDEISDEFTNTPKGVLVYKDGVQRTSVEVRLKVWNAKEEELRLGFNLNSKAPDSEGAMYYLDLETTTQPRVEEE